MPATHPYLYHGDGLGIGHGLGIGGRGIGGKGFGGGHKSTIPTSPFFFKSTDLVLRGTPSKTSLYIEETKPSNVNHLPPLRKYRKDGLMEVSMFTEADKIRLFERIQQQARWLRVSPPLLDDLIQQAWILALEYADKNKKGLSELSETELKFRCQEAYRQVRAPFREQSTDAKWLEEAPGPVIIDEPIITTTSYTDRLEWLLDIHPHLKLTAHQKELWQMLKTGSTRGWQTAYAQQQGLTRQSITNTVRIIKNKVLAATTLLRLINGDIDYFFENFIRGWSPGNLGRVLWDLFRHPLGINIPRELQQAILPLQPVIMRTAFRVLQQESRNLDYGRSIDHQNLARGYNLFYSGIYIDLTSPISIDINNMIENLPASKTLNFFNIAFVIGNYIINPGVRIAEFVDWLIEKLERDDTIGKMYANYNIIYYQGEKNNEKAKFLKTVGNNFIVDYDYGLIISRLYQNMCNSLYAQRFPRLLDINFLRILVMKKYFPFDPSHLSNQSRNALKTITQKALHSPTPFVVRRAEELLATIK